MNSRQRAAVAERYGADGMVGASPQKLLLAVFARLRRDLEDAQSAIASREVERAHRRLLNAQDLVHELDLALDTDVWEGGGPQLRTIYRHLLGVMTEANLTKSPELIAQSLAIVVPLQESWVEADRMLSLAGATTAPSAAAAPPAFDGTQRQR